MTCICKCIEGEFKLKNTIIDYAIYIHLFENHSDYSNPKYFKNMPTPGVDRIISAEMDHFRDYANFVKTALFLALAAENELKMKSYKSESGCKSDCRTAILKSFSDEYNDMMYDSHVKWDDSGKHSWPSR